MLSVWTLYKVYSKSLKAIISKLSPQASRPIQLSSCTTTGRDPEEMQSRGFNWYIIIRRAYSWNAMRTGWNTVELLLHILLWHWARISCWLPAYSCRRCVNIPIHQQLQDFNTITGWRYRYYRFLVERQIGQLQYTYTRSCIIAARGQTGKRPDKPSNEWKKAMPWIPTAGILGCYSDVRNRMQQSISCRR